MRALLFLALASAPAIRAAQPDTSSPRVNVHFRLVLRGGEKSAPPAVLWLKPLEQNAALTFPPHKPYMLMQKNRTFTPHLLVVPVGSQVLFPNEDPFYHNVFSLFDGKRFDLGLYEAGASRTVTFSREGVSYIFCNIHPEMSAVVVALSTPLYAIADASGAFLIRNVPEGQYEAHLWVEGVPQSTLDHFVHQVRVSSAKDDLGAFDISNAAPRHAGHLNKFGQPYDRDSSPY